MKISQNKFQRSIAITVMGFVLSLSFGFGAPAMAQRLDNAGVSATQQPLNLVDPVPANKTDTSGNSDNVTESNAAIDLVAQSGNDADSDLISSEDTPSQPKGELTGNGNAASTSGEPAAATTTGATVTLGRRNVSDVGLAAIGVGDDDSSQTTLDSLIWRGTSAIQADRLLRSDMVISFSPTISDLAHQVVARQSVPPTGANANARDLVNARLSWLARAGRSNDLASLVQQLPNDEQWLDWKKWLVQHQLMMLEDDEACRTVGYQSEQTFEPFWHQTKVICSIVAGDLSSAQFGADILQASGLDDQIFFALVNEMLTGAPATDLDPALIEPIHIVLMDAAHHEIPLDGFMALPQRMIESATSLRYLSADARMVSTFDALALGLIDAKRAAKLWRNVAASEDTAEFALARHGSQPSSLTRSMVWRALDSDGSVSRLPLIAAAMDIDKGDRAAGLMIPLYAELIRTAMSGDGAEAILSDDQSDAAGKIALLLALDNPQSASLPDTFPTFTYADNAAKLLNGLDDESWRNRLLADLNQWHLMPILEAIGMVADSSEWLDLLAEDDQVTVRLETVSLSPVMLRAIKQSAEKRRVAETILLANQLLMSAPLAKVNTRDAAVIIEALTNVGQTGTAKELAREIIIAHLLANTGAVNMSSSIGSWVIPATNAESVDDQQSKPALDTKAPGETESDMGGDNTSDTDNATMIETDNKTEPDNGTKNL